MPKTDWIHWCEVPECNTAATYIGRAIVELPDTGLDVLNIPAAMLEERAVCRSHAGTLRACDVLFSGRVAGVVFTNQRIPTDEYPAVIGVD